MLGSEREYYFKGLRAESQSMGIAAFAYYRRVVENKKFVIFDQIILASELLNAAEVDDLLAYLVARGVR